MNVSKNFSPRITIKNNTVQNSTNPQKTDVKGATDVFTKSKVSFGQAQSLSDYELKIIKKDIEQTLNKRHFSPKLIKEVVSETDSVNHEVVSILAKDECCHSSTIRKVMYSVNERNQDLFKRAALCRDYEAFNGIRDGEIRDYGGIRYMKDVNNKPYRPQWTSVKEYSENEMLHYKNVIIANLSVQKYHKHEIANILKYVDNESVRVITILSTSKVRPDIMTFAAENSNVENAELILRACSYDDYDVIFPIVFGKIRTAGEIDERAEKRYQNGYSQNQSYKQNQRTESQNPPQSTGKWTKEQFLAHIDEKINKNNFHIYSLKDSEIRNLAKLLNTNTEQITKMDKTEYRKLSMKFHPDKNPDDKTAESCFKIVTTLFANSPLYKK